MPLIKSASRDAIQKNIQELSAANAGKPADKKRPQKQIVAIALHTADQAKKGK